MADISNTKHLITIIILCILGVFFLVVVYGSIKRDKFENTWPSTSAIILKSELSTGPVENSGSTVRSNGFNWRLKMEYSFYVDDKKYISNIIGSQNDDKNYYDSKQYSSESKIPESIAKLQNQYPVGSQATVYYNPTNPDDCFIVKDSTNGAMISAIILSILFLGSAAIIFKFVK